MLFENKKISAADSWSPYGQTDSQRSKMVLKRDLEKAHYSNSKAKKLNEINKIDIFKPLLCMIFNNNNFF